MLAQYLTQTARLLQNPPAAPALYATSDLTSFINTARGQVAGDAECIRVLGSLPLAVGNRGPYPFSAINVGTSSVTGVDGPFNVRQVMVVIGGGNLNVRSRPWPWFQLYKLSRVVPPTGRPSTFSQYAQGTSGSLYFDPVPDVAYVAAVDTVCRPIALVDDTTVEAIPYPWTDAVPFFAAYLALLSAQRAADADAMLKRYENFRDRARKSSTPGVLPGQYPQQSDPTMENKLGLAAQRGGAGG